MQHRIKGRVASLVEVEDGLGAEEVEDAACSESNLLSCSVSSARDEGTSCSRNRGCELRRTDGRIEDDVRGESFEFSG